MEIYETQAIRQYDNHVTTLLSLISNSSNTGFNIRRLDLWTKNARV